MDDPSMLENVKTFKGKIIYHCESDPVKPLWRVTANYQTNHKKMLIFLKKAT